MPFYKTLDNRKPADRKTAEGLLRLKAALDLAIPPKTVDATLLLASWNLREFGGTKFGGRSRESLFYISEILSRFDLIAVQEVRDNLDALDELMSILGGWWKYLVSDTSQGTAGNQERHAFIYDTRKLSFGGLVGELVPPPDEKDGLLTAAAAARTPFLVGFRAGWFKFTICTQHFYYGQAKADDPQRLREAEMVVELFKKRMKSKDRWANNAILLGDFNIFTTEDKTFLALEKGKFLIPTGLRGKYTNASLNKPFDQMAFIAPDVERQIHDMRAGVFPFYDHVYRDDEWEQYGQPDFAKYKQWRTFQMSDHLPIWVELGVDFGGEYLQNKATPPPPASPPAPPPV